MSIMKCNDIYRSVYGMTLSTGFLGWVFLNQFMDRCQFLIFRLSQIINRLKVEATEGGLKQNPNELLNCVVKIKLSPDRLFNMEETKFSQMSKLKKFVSATE